MVLRSYNPNMKITQGSWSHAYPNISLLTTQALSPISLSTIAKKQFVLLQLAQATFCLFLEPAWAVVGFRTVS